jgi:hypothetical protein
LNESSPYQSPQQEPATKSAFSPAPILPSATTSVNENWTLKEKLVYGLLTAVGIGGSVWLGLKMYKKAIANKEESKSFEDGTPATIAKQIKMAFDNDGWWGTDVTALRQILMNVPSQKVWEDAQKSYTKLYSTATDKAVLLKDMSDELQTSEYNEMMQIINSKPLKNGQASQGNSFKAWAKRLKAAFDKAYGIFGGTDGEAIVATLNEMPTQKAFIYTGVEYKKMYGKNLMDDLKSESEFGQYDEWLAIIVKKKK